MVELLHPEHEPAHVLIELKREMGPIAFSAQYQQTPIPPGGTIIKRKWLTTYDQIASRPDDRIVMSWDIALSEIESGDYSACVVLLIRKEIVYILEVCRAQPINERGRGGRLHRLLGGAAVTAWRNAFALAAGAPGRCKMPTNALRTKGKTGTARADG